MYTSHASRSTARVVLLAVSLQVCKLLLAIAADQFLPDYDTSAVFNVGICAANTASLNAVTDTARSSGNRASVELSSNHNGSAGLPWYSEAAWRLIVWDSVFFMRIACNGYQYEQEYAFFPLLPALLRLWRSYPAALPVAALLTASAVTACAAVLLYCLTVSITHDTQLASMSALLYMFNPASIFYTAAYTESLFGFLTLLGLCVLYTPIAGHSGSNDTVAEACYSQGTSQRQQAGLTVTCLRLWTAGVCFMLGTATRSNGVINAGFLLHVAMQACLIKFGHAADKQATLLHRLQAVVRCVMVLASAAGTACMTFLPLVLHQLHAHAQFCAGLHGASDNPVLQDTRAGLVLRALMAMLWHPKLETDTMAAGTHSGMQAAAAGWCLRHPAWWPAVYGHVQKQYWDVGLFHYWRPSQVPNFVLAAPVLVLAVNCIMSYARQKPWHLLLGGFSWPVWTSGTKATDMSVDAHMDAQAFNEVAKEGPGSDGIRRRSTRLTAQAVAQQQQDTTTSTPQLVVGNQQQLQGAGPAGTSAVHTCSDFFSNQAAVFVYPLAFMTACALLVMHVQVATRFLSSSPPLYWYMAHILLQRQQAPSKQSQQTTQCSASNAGRVIWGWCWAYMLVGTVLFANFLPWT